MYSEVKTQVMRVCQPYLYSDDFSSITVVIDCWFRRWAEEFGGWLVVGVGFLAIFVYGLGVQ